MADRLAAIGERRLGGSQGYAVTTRGQRRNGRRLELSAGTDPVRIQLVVLGVSLEYAEASTDS